MRQWRQTRPDWKNTVGAALVAAGAAAVSFYLVRILLAREELPKSPPSGTPALVEGGGKEGGDRAQGPRREA